VGRSTTQARFPRFALVTVWDSENLSVNRDPFNRAGQRKAHRSTRVRFASFRARVTKCAYGMSPPIFGLSRRGETCTLGVSAHGSTQNARKSKRRSSSTKNVVTSSARGGRVEFRVIAVRTSHAALLVSRDTEEARGIVVSSTLSARSIPRPRAPRTVAHATPADRR